MKSKHHYHGGRWRRRVLVVLLVVLPVTASLVYMWTMWDPAPYLRNVPIAVVNEDEGTVYNGKELNYGKDVADTLASRDYLSVEQVSAETAEDGLKNNDYLMTIRVPKDFSANAMSMAGEEPKKADIEIVQNDFNGTAGAFLTGSLIPQLKGGD